MDRANSQMLLWFILLQSISIFGQIVPQNIDFNGIITDSITNETLPYANVTNLTNDNATATNLEGYFLLPNSKIGDTLIISYIGYLTKTLVVSKDIKSKIRLLPNLKLIDEVVITAKSDFVYNLIADIKKNHKTLTKTAKTYFYLETQKDNIPLEMIEAYYNGDYSNGGIESLDLKKGRIGIKHIDNRYFCSTASSRTFSMHDIFKSNKLFPDNPLTLSKKDLRNKYKLSILNYEDENSSKIYEINFSPKTDTSNLFSGKLIINFDKKTLIKSIFTIQNTKSHPFVALGLDSVLNLDMEISRTYEDQSNKSFLSSIDFIYKINYQDDKQNRFDIITTAYLKAYSYDQIFNLPLFDFSKHFHEDYRNITLTNYDSTFWNRSKEFRFYDRKEKVEAFISKNKFVSDHFTININKEITPFQLEFPYLKWSKKRFLIRQASIDKIEKAEAKFTFPSERYKFNAKLYLDVNIVDDSLTYQVESIIDPVGTFYHFYRTDQDIAFMNIYFDLLEVSKRKLVTKLSEIKTLTESQVYEIYQNQEADYKEMVRKYVNDVDHGKNYKKLLEWNDFIEQQLGINTFLDLNLKK